MTEVQTATARVCPACGNELVEDGETFHCDADGDFFQYSPHLLIRCASETTAPSIPRQMPWEHRDARA